MVPKNTNYKNVWNFLEKCVARYGDLPLMESKPYLAKRKWTYKSFYEDVLKFAYLLNSQNLKTEDKVAFWAPNSPEWRISFYACVLLKLIPVPLDVNSSTSFIEGVTLKTEPKYLLSSHKLNWPEKDYPLPSFNLEDLRYAIKDLNPLDPKPYKEKIKSDDVLEILYTSGTTGHPHGVIITHKTEIMNLKNTLEVFPTDIDYSTISLLPLSHLLQQFVDLFAIFAVGGFTVYPNKLNSSVIRKLLKEYKITALVAVPKVYQILKEAIETKLPTAAIKRIARIFPSTKMKRLIFYPIHRNLGGHFQLAFCGGAPLNPEIAKFWENLGVSFIQAYGATETGPVLSLTSYKNRNSTSVGRLIPNQELKIVDGEILTRGDHVTPGYFKDPEETKKVFTRDQWYKTGDMGYLEGQDLYLKGRKKNMIVPAHGLNVYPEDIEQVLDEHKEIKESCVVGIKDKGEEKVFAVLITDLDYEPTKKLIEKVNQTLSEHQWIHDFAIYSENEFPKTHTHKILRHEVKDWVLKSHLEKKDKVEKVKIPTPTKAKETPLLEILSEITQKDPSEIKGETNLVMDLKLDSLSRAELTARIAEELEVFVKEESINETTTFSDLERLALLGKPAEETKPAEKWFLLKPLTFLRSITSPLLRFGLHLLYKIEVEGVENLEEITQPAIITANHISHWDGLLIFLHLPKRLRRNIVIASAGDFWERPIYKQIFRLLQIFLPLSLLNREVNIKKGIEDTAEYLNLGYSILIFPEGTISPDGNLGEFKKGPVLFAKEFETPVVPGHLSGFEKIWTLHQKFPKFSGSGKIKFGEPFNISPLDSTEAETEKIKKAIALLPESSSSWHNS